MTATLPDAAPVTAADAASSAASPRAGRREWIGLAVIALPCLLYAMDLTVLNLAVPSLSEQLMPSSVQLLWIVDIYGFLVAGSLMTMGTLGDRIGRRKLLLIGAAAFGVASIMAAFATSPAMLIATRALLGLAGATFAPSTLSLIRNMFLDAQQRTVAIGVWISSYSVGGAIGPLVGGLVLEHFSWPAVFLVGVPVMILLLVVGPVLLPEYRDPEAGRLDVPSAALSLACVLAVIFGLKQIAQNGVSAIAMTSIAAGVITGAIFIHRQRTVEDPLIDPRLFRAPAFSASLALYTGATFVVFGVFVFISQYLQLVLGLSPLSAGLWTMPFAGAFIVGSTLTPLIVRRVPPAILMAAGLLVAAIGFVLLTQIHDNGRAALPLLVTSYLTFCLGLAPVFTLATDIIVGSAPPERAGVAAAISETGSELGGALGIAILGSIGTAAYRRTMTIGVPAGVPAEAAAAARDTLGGAVTAAAQLPADLGAALLATARGAFVQALDLLAIVSVVLVLIMAVVAISMQRWSSAPGDHHS
jgi:DHA2 family multidrug resistance protein-like MFS transporter